MCKNSGGREEEAVVLESTADSCADTEGSSASEEAAEVLAAFFPPTGTALDEETEGMKLRGLLLFFGALQSPMALKETSARRLVNRFSGIRCILEEMQRWKLTSLANFRITSDEKSERRLP